MIDGYLHNASICINRNSNKICEPSKEIPARTKKLGKVTINLDDAQYPIIAKAIVEIAKDSDQATPLTKPYELIAPANADLVTPFSTIAHLRGLSPQELVDNIYVDYTAINKDYLADIGSESKVAHLLARSITPLLEKQVIDNKMLTLNNNILEIKALIDKQVNEDVDLSNIDISYDTQLADFYSKPKVTNVESHMNRNSFTYSIFSNHYIANGRGYENSIVFNDGDMNIDRVQSPYQLDGNGLEYEDNSFNHE